jgi:hypothetical protein
VEPVRTGRLFPAVQALALNVLAIVSGRK